MNQDLQNKNISNSSFFEPLILPRGPAIKNRFILAPLTNTQSHQDGTLSDDEYRWLTMRAEGGFGLVTTCASHVQLNGQGFPGQLGCFSDDHLPSLTRLATGIRQAGAVSSLQLQHSGIRALPGQSELLGASDDPQTGARAMSNQEVEAMIAAFVTAAKRAETAGFDGIQIHGGHGYIITQFLSSVSNRRTDQWGGSFENRSRLLLEILNQIRASCGSDFQIGIRISPERFGLHLPEMIELAQILFDSAKMDYLDLSLWDIRKEAEDKSFRGQTLASLFTRLDRGTAKIGLAGKIMSGADAVECLADEADYVAIGRAGILTHDFPNRVRDNAGFLSPNLPVTESYLRKEGLGSAFIGYMSSFPGFVEA